jgi:hypothetical protein
VLKSAQITKKTISKLVSIQSLNFEDVYNEYPSNNKLSKIVKLLINGTRVPKTKITIHFIVNITIFENLLFEGYSCKRLQTL